MPSTAVTDDYVAPVFLTDEARDLNDRFYLILNNLVKTFPSYKSDPRGATYYDTSITNTQDYDNNMADMLSLQSDYFTYKNRVVYTSELLMKQVGDVDTQINVIDRENIVLKSKLGEMANSSRSAEGMLDDSQLTRNQLFYGNIVLFLFMMGGGYMYYKNVYKATSA
jgi:hypothetical protein